MKKILMIISILLFFKIAKTQTNIFIEYPNTQPDTPWFYGSCNFNKIVRTHDKGYILSYNPYAPNIHGAYPVDFLTIKTDSNFVPVWKKPGFYQANALPTGGIILISADGYETMIQKITAGGQMVWQKIIGSTYPDALYINDAVCYADRITLVGSHWYDNMFVPSQYFRNATVFTLDTSGNVISKSEFTSTNYNYDAFVKIVRDNSGNFFISGENSILSKFNSSMTLIWSKTDVNPYSPKIKDIQVLSNGDLFCIGSMVDTLSAYSTGCFLKFNSAGTLLSGNYFFNGSPNYLSALEKTSTGNFVTSHWVGSQPLQDSTCILSIDSNATILWARKYQKALATGSGKSLRNKIYFPLYTKDPAVFSINEDGSNSCGSISVTRTLASGTYSVLNNTFIVMTSTVPVSNSTLSLANQTQVYNNKCGSVVGLVKNKKTDENLIVYPNPVRDVIHLRSDLENDIKPVYIYTSLGEKNQVEIISQGNEISISTRALSNGLYFLVMQSSEGEIIRKPFIVSR